MVRLASAWIVVALALPCTSQDSRPQSADSVKKREGGFHGITFVERMQDGHAVLDVRAVVEASDAERLGFRKGDKILGVNGERMRNGDHFIQMLYATMPELRARMGGGKAPRGGNAIDVLRDGKPVAIRGGLAELDQTPRVGDAAPAFTLQDPGGRHEVALAKLIGKRPVVLVFGSFT